MKVNKLITKENWNIDYIRTFVKLLMEIEILPDLIVKDDTITINISLYKEE